MTARMMPIQRPVGDAVERVQLAPGFTVSRLTIGLRQASGMERDGEAVQPELTSAALAQYLDAGFTTFAIERQRQMPVVHTYHWSNASSEYQ